MLPVPEDPGVRIAFPRENGRCKERLPAFFRHFPYSSKDMTTNMAQKLIEDGSGSAKRKTARKILAVGAVLMLAGLLCFFLKSISVEYIDSQGILHENFFICRSDSCFCLWALSPRSAAQSGRFSPVPAAGREKRQEEKFSES